MTKRAGPNAMTAAWGGICCSSPPCVTVSLRKVTYSYQCIVDSGAYTLSIPSETYLEAADYLGMASVKNADKFKTAGLTPVKSDRVNAPYVKEFPLVLECKLIHTLEIGLHTQFVGEILDIKADESILAENGLPAIEKLKPMLYATAEKAYFSVGSKIGDAFSIGKGLK